MDRFHKVSIKLRIVNALANIQRCWNGGRGRCCAAGGKDIFQSKEIRETVTDDAGAGRQ